MLEIYQRVAELYVKRINEVFTSEDTMKAEFYKMFPFQPDKNGKMVESIEFSRTDHWNAILWKMFEDAWLEAGPEVKSKPTGYDKLTIMKLIHPLLDYNLFTQVCLNLQGYTGMAYRLGDAQAVLNKIKGSWKHPKLNPFAPKVKRIKDAKDKDEVKFNSIIGRVRSVNLIAQFDGQSSFRVTPKGSTPAFADSRNLSMIGVEGDRYLKTLPNLKPFYISWLPGTTPQFYTSKEQNFQTCGNKPGTNPMVLHFPGIEYPILSSSGGDITNEVMFSRFVMYEVFHDFDILNETCIMIPRMNSVLVVTQVDGKHIKQTFERLKAQYPVLEFNEGVRYKEEEAVDEVESVPQSPFGGA